MNRAKRLLVIGAESHYGRGVVEGVHRYCRTHGRWEYHLEADNSAESVKRSEFALRRWKADGIVACVQNSKVAGLVRRSGIPGVNVTGVDDWGLPSVWADFSEIGRLVARHFAGSGFRHFGFCVKSQQPHSLKKYEGFSEVLAAAGFTSAVLTEPPQAPGEWDLVDSHRRRSRWLRMLKKPVAVMCTFDYLANDMVGVCEHLGLRVPEDVAIVGVQNHESLCLMSTPPLSSVEMPTMQIGYEAARLVHRLIQGAHPPGKPVLVGGLRLVTRQSSDTVALEDPELVAVMRFIRRRALEPIAVKDILQAVPISRRVMEQRFSKLIGRTPKSEIMRIRMEQARHLLTATELMIPEVAQQSGFTNPETFAIAFHRVMGQSPSLYRRQSRIDGRL